MTQSTDTVDLSVDAYIVSDTYVAWLYAAPFNSKAHEVHAVPKNPDHPVVILKYAVSDLPTILMSILDQIFTHRPSLLADIHERYKPITYEDPQRRTLQLCLTPIDNPLYQRQYPQHTVTQLVWSDQDNNFPWDAGYDYHHLIQPLLYRTSAVIH